MGQIIYRPGEETRAKDAKDAKVKGMEDEEIAGVVVEGAFALDREVGLGMLVDGQGRGQDRLFTLGGLGVLGANPFRGLGRESREGRKG